VSVLTGRESAAGYDIGYGAAAAGRARSLRAGRAAMFWAADSMTLSGAALALRTGHSSQRRVSP